MPVTINGDGTITGLVVGGLPDGCVDTDTIANSAVTPAKSTISGGISALSIWYLTTSFSGDANPVVNWAKYNLDYNTGGFGDDMTESNGIFTFPTTGYWQVHCQAYFYGGGSAGGGAGSVAMSAALSVDSGSSYDLTTRRSYSNVPSTSGYWYSQNVNTHYYDITNTSTTRLKLRVEGAPPQTDPGGTFVRFMRLADT